MYGMTGNVHVISASAPALSPLSLQDTSSTSSTSSTS